MGISPPNLRVKSCLAHGLLYETVLLQPKKQQTKSPKPQQSARTEVTEQTPQASEDNEGTAPCYCLCYHGNGYYCVSKKTNRDKMLAAVQDRHISRR